MPPSSIICGSQEPGGACPSLVHRSTRNYNQLSHNSQALPCLSSPFLFLMLKYHTKWTSWLQRCICALIWVTDIHRCCHHNWYSHTEFEVMESGYKRLRCVCTYTLVCKCVCVNGNATKGALGLSFTEHGCKSKIYGAVWFERAFVLWAVVHLDLDAAGGWLSLGPTTLRMYSPLALLCALDERVRHPGSAVMGKLWTLGTERCSLPFLLEMSCAEFFFFFFFYSRSDLKCQHLSFQLYLTTILSSFSCSLGF